MLWSEPRAEAPGCPYVVTVRVGLVVRKRLNQNRVVGIVDDILVETSMTSGASRAGQRNDDNATLYLSVTLRPLETSLTLSDCGIVGEAC